MPGWGQELFVVHPSKTSIINYIWIAKKIEAEVLLAPSWKEWLVVYQGQVWKLPTGTAGALQMPICTKECSRMFRKLRSTACCQSIGCVLLLLLSCFSRVRLWDPRDGNPPGSPSLGFSRQEHWSGLPFPSPGCVLGTRFWRVLSVCCAEEFFFFNVLWKFRYTKGENKIINTHVLIT